MTFQHLNSILVASIPTKSVPLVNAKIVLMPHPFWRKFALPDFSLVQAIHRHTPDSLYPLFSQRSNSTCVIPPGDGSMVLYLQILPDCNFLLHDAESMHNLMTRWQQKWHENMEYFYMLRSNSVCPGETESKTASFCFRIPEFLKI